MVISKLPKRFVGATLVALISAVLVFSLALPVAAQSTGGIGGRPANPDPETPRSQSIFIYTADKGESRQDAVAISNNTDSEQTINLYAVDGMVTNAGAFTCRQRAEPRQGLGDWVRLNQDQITLAAGESKNVGFTLAVPSQADVGEHNGCLVFESPSPESELSTGNVRVRTRQAVRIVNTVPGELELQVAIDQFTFSQNPGAQGAYQQQYFLRLQNSGNVSADVTTIVRLTDLFGRTVWANDGGNHPVLANQKLELTFTNSERPFFGGLYFAQAEIAYDKRAGVFGTDDAANLTYKYSDKQLVFVWPTAGGWMTIAALMLALAGIIAWVVYGARQRRMVRTAWVSYTTTSGDTLQSVATKHHIRWQRLAKANRIRPPYELTAGTKLQVPKQNIKKDRAGSQR